MQKLLYFTIITTAEMLDWHIHDQHIQSALADEAYARWLEEDKEQAQYYANCWTASFIAQPSGFHVQLEAEDDTADAEIKISIPHKMVECARELAAELSSIGKEIDSLGIDEWPVINHLDGQATVAYKALADEYLALLVNAGLIVPLVKETE